MLQHLSTRPPTTRPRGPNPQRSAQLLLCWVLVYFSFSLSFVSSIHFSGKPPPPPPPSPPPPPFPLLQFAPLGFPILPLHTPLPLFCSLPPFFRETPPPPPKKTPHNLCDLLFYFLCNVLHLPSEKAESRELMCVRGVPKRARLVTWWHEWAPLLAAAGPSLHTPSGSVELCQTPLYLLPPAPPPPASSSIPQQWATVTEPHCVWCGRTHRRSLCFHFKRPNRQHGLYF